MRTWTQESQRADRPWLPWREAWPPGPWMTEPDKAVWIDEATGLDCMIHRNQFGALCGYVGLGPSHRLHGVDFVEVEVEVDVAVHGGLTYAATCDDQADEEHGLCHVPEPGRPHDVWWLGFDCNHSGDYAPCRVASPWDQPDAYRTFAYVQAEVTALAAQLAEAT